MGGIGIAFLAGFLIVCNVVLGLVLVIKFKKTVSDKTNEVIGAAKREMELIIADMNRQTDRNITLFQNHQGELKALIAEAERHVTVARNEIEKLNQLQAQIFAQRVQQATPVRASVHQQAGRSVPAGRAAEQYLRSAGTAPVQPQTAYTVTDEGKKHVVHQGDLFEEVPVSAEPNMFTVARDGAAYTSMPVIGPQVTYVDDPVQPKKDFGTQVRELYDRGESVEDIATALGRSTTEVQFALDMGA